MRIRDEALDTVSINAAARCGIIQRAHILITARMSRLEVARLNRRDLSSRVVHELLLRIGREFLLD